MPKVYALVGLDCDRPRGNFINSPEGSAMAEDKFRSLSYISDTLERLQIPRTYFLCGQFVESMISKYGLNPIRELFEGTPSLVEIADHSYSHSVYKKIEKRPDKIPLSVGQIIAEYRHNTDLLSTIFQRDLKKRGLRTPLGHWRGLTGENQIISALISEGVLYVSSDLRQEDDSICPSLLNDDGSLRQPYHYSGGLLEIPSHGWHDTAFNGMTKTPLTLRPPYNYVEIKEYYSALFTDAVYLSKSTNFDLYIGLVMHPYNVWHYDKHRLLFDDLYQMLQEMEIGFCNYKQVYSQFL